MITELEFIKIIKDFPHYDKFVIGVSGGSDSMALVMLLNEFLLNNYGSNKNMIAITVDHQLRKESRSEAELVKSWLNEKDIQHEILTWKHDLLTSRIEELGRIARYELMSEYCKLQKIKSIFTAHHAMDQIETFLMRLKRGSGLSGLCGIRPISFINEIQINRPFLSIFPETLKETLQIRFNQEFVHDPYNDDQKFERVKIRKNMSVLEEFGFDKKSIISSVNHFQSLEKEFYTLVNKSYGKYVKIIDEKVYINKEILKLEIPQVVKLLFKDIFAKTFQSTKTCTQKVLDGLYEKISKQNFVATTANCCLIRKKGQSFELSKENRPKRKE